MISQEACDNGQYASGIYVDFKKAFNTINHNILLDKLAHYGVWGIENNWFNPLMPGGNKKVTHT